MVGGGGEALRGHIYGPQKERFDLGNVLEYGRTLFTTAFFTLKKNKKIKISLVMIQ